jgi:alkanesulfonate monooxygenase SsuD/methylene tetrahydromethanopterin reductase-like flavin-dependent oxidoreductase (luciferase family)
VTESRGIPSVSVITSAFTRAAHARAAALGMPDARIVILPSPLASRSVAEVQRLAHEYAQEIVGLLRTN